MSSQRPCLRNGVFTSPAGAIATRRVAIICEAREISITSRCEWLEQEQRARVYAAGEKSSLLGIIRE